MPAGEKSSFFFLFLSLSYKCFEMCLCVCVCGTHLCVQTLNSVSAKNMREKHFDRFSSRPRRGTLDVTATLFTGGRKVRGGLSLLKVLKIQERRKRRRRRWPHGCMSPCLHAHMFVSNPPSTYTDVSFSTAWDLLVIDPSVKLKNRVC